MKGFTAVEFSQKEKAVIYTNALKVMGNYQTIINQMGVSVVSDIEKAKSNSESFLELFVNRQVLLYNDLDPAHKLSEFYEAETYASNILLWYPDGITINLNLANAKVGEILQHEETVYSVDLMVTKSINGNYLNETLNKNTEELTFRIAFGIANNNPTNFRIVGIRSASSNVVVDYSQALKEVNSENLSIGDLNKIYSEIKAELQDYTNFLSLLGDPQEAADDKEFYKTSFRKLFKEDTKLFNDIMPEPPIKLISVQDYLNSYIADYPNGIKNIKINSDSAKFGKIMKADDKSYYTYVDVNKFFSGSYKGKDVFRQMFPLIFKISFNESGKTYTNFAINSVDISSVNFYKDTPEGMLEKKPSMIISPVTRKGWGVSVIGSFGVTSIINKNIEALTLPTDSVAWKSSSNYGYIGAIGVSYYFNDNLAVRTGLELNKYSGKFNLSGMYTDNVLSAELPNGTLFYKVIDARYDSLVTINYITIPILLNYTSGKPGKTGFYAEAGAKVSIPAFASYTNKGYYKYFGDYPSKPLGSQYDSIPDKGFYSRRGINQTENVKMKGINLSFYASAGINIPLGYYSSVMIGPEIAFGLTDIMRSSKSYTDIFGKTHDHLPVKINNFGIRLSFAYKL
jgi:Outer membrane protein beta-barrel domain